ncbi:MAG: hypothetical protein IPO55_05015 [Alphaproteobacteria bacterium]|nr:hypothetical protein [Alphaproteobacteria bacterium]
MKGFLKEHFVLIIGISLPLILSLVFFASANFRFETIPPPQYPVVFAQDFYYRNNPEYPYKLAVNEEKTLELRYTPSSAENAANWQVPQIYLYDPKQKGSSGSTCRRLRPERNPHSLWQPSKQGKWILPSPAPTGLRSAPNTGGAAI